MNPINSPCETAGMVELAEGQKLLKALPDSNLDSIGCKMFKAMRRSEKLEWIESRLSQMAGKRVAECWMEEGAKDDRVTLSASFEDGTTMDVELKEIRLVDLPEFILERIVRLVNPQTPKEVFRVMGSCGTLRRVTGRMNLPALAHIGGADDKYKVLNESEYAKFLQLVNICGTHLRRIVVDITSIGGLRSAEHVAVTLPNLEILELYEKSESTPLLEQLTAAGPNLHRLVAVTKEISSTALCRIQTLPLSFLCLCTDSTISGVVFQSSNLETLVIRKFSDYFRSRMSVSDQVVLSTLRSSPQSLRSLLLVGVGVVDSFGKNESCEIEDSQCCVMSFYYTYGSDSFFNRLCHRNLTHLHFRIGRDQGEFCVRLFENARFSLRQLLLLNGVKELEAVVRNVFQRNRELEVVCLTVLGKIHRVSGAAFNGIRNLRNLRGFLISGFVLSDPAVLLSMFSCLNHPNLQLVYWDSIVIRQNGTNPILDRFRAMRMPSCVFNVLSNPYSFCSHSAYEGLMRHSCSECVGTFKNVLQCEECEEALVW